MSIKQMHEQSQQAYWQWRNNRTNQNWDAKEKAIKEFLAAAKEIVANLPFPWTTAYAYNPHEHANSNGRDHIILRQELHIGRLQRNAGDALCKPRDKFWGLEEVSNGSPTCVKCLEIAERTITPKAKQAAA
ncbi:MAG: hypothetical protein AB1489_14195 [Acidobacteriota bacterium]